jgi:23S rRNA pseudouridine1911/1915/1917 synthase
VDTQSTKIKDNDIIKINFQEEISKTIQPSNKPIKIIYEDKDLIIINKPQGMVVHPGAGNKNDTLVNILVGNYKKKLSDLNGSTRPGIVHRIDKDTSGLLVVAKNNFTHSNLGKQFSDHSIKRKYIALVWGVLRPLKGTIETFITRNKRNRQLMTADEFKGKKAITKYSIIKVFNKKNIPKISLIEFELETGRTHQIRVHMIYKGTSILGDQKYRKRNMKFKKIDKQFEEILNSFKGQVLHASTLGFYHPRNLKKIEFKTKLPFKFKKLVDYLENLKN